MAHEKLSPRQQMIGMMYLVLTAMLALNVSKDAVEAFKNVDNGLTLTISNYAAKNDAIYKDFDRAAAENPQKAGELRTAAYEVKERADEIFEFIQQLKIEIITIAEGEDTEAIDGNEVFIDHVTKIDENNIPSQILIGANEDGKAYTLKAYLNDYRDFLITTLDGKSIATEESVRKTLNTDDVKSKKTGETVRWENHTFQALPLVAVITILSKLQVDVRNAETEVIDQLYTQIDASSFKFNKLTSIVIPNSNYVTLGSTYEAQVFISATDTTQQPVITVGDQVLPLDEAGKGIYTVKPSSLGTKTWGGVITLKAPDGTDMQYPFVSEYVVGEASVICSPTAMNVMYYGIANPIDVSVPGVSPDKISIRVVNGTHSTEKVKNSKGENFKGTYSVKPSEVGKNVQVIVSANINGVNQTFAPYEFRVKSIPVPEARFGGLSSGNIAKNTAVAQAGVFAVLPDFDFDLQYTVTGFSILYSDRMGDLIETSTSSMLTSAQKDLINRMTRGKDLIIKDIKATGPDGVPRTLLPIILKID